MNMWCPMPIGRSAKRQESQPEIERRPARRKQGKALYILSALLLLAGLFFLFTYGEQIWEQLSKKAGNISLKGSSPMHHWRSTGIPPESEEPASTAEQTTIAAEPEIPSTEHVLQKSSEIEMTEPEPQSSGPNSRGNRLRSHPEPRRLQKQIPRLRKQWFRPFSPFQRTW